MVTGEPSRARHNSWARCRPQDAARRLRPARSPPGTSTAVGCASTARPPGTEPTPCDEAIRIRVPATPRSPTSRRYSAVALRSPSSACAPMVLTDRSKRGAGRRCHLFASPSSPVRARAGLSALGCARREHVTHHLRAPRTTCDRRSSSTASTRHRHARCSAVGDWTARRASVRMFRPGLVAATQAEPDQRAIYRRARRRPTSRRRPQDARLTDKFPRFVRVCSATRAFLSA